MQVWFVRHAIAEDRETFSGPDDERPLTDKGRQQFRAFVEWLAKRGHVPQVVITSPLVRAVETALLLSKASGLKKKYLVFDEALAPGINLEAVLELLRRQTVETVAVVGHEPDFSSVTAQLIGGGRLAFGKGNIACLNFDGPPDRDNAELLWFAGPKWVAG